MGDGATLSGVRGSVREGWTGGTGGGLDGRGGPIETV